MEKVDVIYPVGKGYTYQNVMYSLIGPIIESATQKKYDELLRERLIQPLGMKDITFTWRGLTASANYAHPHVKRDGKWTPTVVRDTYYNVQPAAGINASIHDMAYWLRGLVSNDPAVISPEIMNEICEPLIATKQERSAISKVQSYPRHLINDEARAGHVTRRQPLPFALRRSMSAFMPYQKNRPNPIWVVISLRNPYEFELFEFHLPC